MLGAVALLCEAISKNILVTFDLTKKVTEVISSLFF